MLKHSVLVVRNLSIIIVVVGIVLLFTFKPEKKPIKIPSDFKIVERGDSSAFVYIK